MFAVMPFAAKIEAACFCEYVRLYSAVVCNSNLKIALACVLEVVCKTLSSLTYGINVHSVLYLRR